MKNCFLFACCCWLVAGCASTPKPVPETTTHYDEFSGLRTDLLADNMLTAEGPPRELIWLNASRVFRNLREADYYLEVTYMAPPEIGYFEIAPGQSLTVTVDEQDIHFSGSGSAGLRRTQEKMLVERAIYPATKSQLQRIAIGNQIKVRVSGRKGLIDRDFKDENKDKFRKFVTLYAL